MRIDNDNQRLFLVLLAAAVLLSAVVCMAPRRKTEISIDGDQWRLNGAITYPATAAEGLLMNVRMVNSTFEDRNRADFDPEANTDRFIEKMPEYIASGVRAFTLNLQGGMPGYEGALNTVYETDGALRPSYLARIKRVIEAADRLGAAVILGCFYQRQDQFLKDEAAVRAAVVNVCAWIKDERFANVLLEIANEFGHSGFDHTILKTSEGQVDLINLARATNPNLLVSTSGLGHGKLQDIVAAAADFPIIHFNNTPVDSIPARVATLKKFGKPILCNEDDKDSAEGARALTVSVESDCSWGLMLSDINQYQPFEFNGPDDDPIIYHRLRELTMN